MRGWCLLFVAMGCSAPPRSLRLEDFVRPGVDMEAEAEAVSSTLERAGWERTESRRSERFIALAFRRGEAERAVRVVTGRGVAVSLDSHEPNGVVLRHGAVGLAAAPNPVDVTRDGVPEIVVSRVGPDGSTCIAILSVDEAGSARAVAVESHMFAPGACPASLADVDDDGRLEVMVTLRWPHLAIDEVPSIDIALGFADGAFSARELAVDYLGAERARRQEALGAARGRHAVDAASRLSVELAALAGLGGASWGAQVRVFDDGVSGLILSEDQAGRLDTIRDTIRRGWPELPP